MFVSKVSVFVLALAPFFANAAATKLVCASANGSTEIRFVQAERGLVKIYTPTMAFAVDGAKVAPLFAGHAEKMSGVALEATDVPGLVLSFDNIGEGDYGRPVLQTMLKINQGGKVANGVLGQCSLATHYGY